MKRTAILSVSIAALIALGAGLAVSAPGYGPGGCRDGQPGMGQGPMPGRMMGRGPAAGKMEARIAAAEQRLALSDEQRPAWERFVGAMRSHQAQRAAHHERARALRGGDGDFVARIEQRAALMEDQLEQMRTVAAAGRDLNAVLTPEQRAVLAGLGGPRRGF